MNIGKEKKGDERMSLSKFRLVRQSDNNEFSVHLLAPLVSFSFLFFFWVGEGDLGERGELWRRGTCVFFVAKVFTDFLRGMYSSSRNNWRISIDPFPEK